MPRRRGWHVVSVRGWSQQRKAAGTAPQPGRGTQHPALQTGDPAPRRGTAPAPAARGSFAASGQRDRAPLDPPFHPHGPGPSPARHRWVVGWLLTPRSIGTGGWMCAVAAVGLGQTHPTEPAVERNQPSALCRRLGGCFGSAADPECGAACARASESVACEVTEGSLTCPDAHRTGSGALPRKWQQCHPAGAGVGVCPRLHQPSSRFHPPLKTAGDQPAPCPGQLPSFSRLLQSFVQFLHRAASQFGVNCTGMFSESAF